MIYIPRAFGSSIFTWPKKFINDDLPESRKNIYLDLIKSYYMITSFRTHFNNHKSSLNTGIDMEGTKGNLQWAVIFTFFLWRTFWIDRFISTVYRLYREYAETRLPGEKAFRLINLIVLLLWDLILWCPMQNLWTCSYMQYKQIERKKIYT